MYQKKQPVNLVWLYLLVPGVDEEDVPDVEEDGVAQHSNKPLGYPLPDLKKNKYLYVIGLKKIKKKNKNKTKQKTKNTYK